MNEFLYSTLRAQGLAKDAATALANIELRKSEAGPRRPFREPRTARDEAIFVKSGLLCKYISESGGGRQIVGLRFPGETILPSRRDRRFGIQAIVKSQVLVADADALDAVMADHHEIAALFYEQSQRDNAINHEWMLNTGRRDSISRVSHLLLETAHRSQKEGDFAELNNPFTQQQIADITGQTSVNVNRVLADLERRGLIQREGRRIIFTDRRELERLSGFRPDYLQ